jgi:hypothetical protein
VYTDAGGNKVNIGLPATSEIRALGLVTYILPSKIPTEALEFHLAWEIEVGNGHAPVKIAYIDAISGEIIAAE